MLPYEWEKQKGGGPETVRGRSRQLRVTTRWRGGGRSGKRALRATRKGSAYCSSHGQACLPNMATDGSALRTPPVPRGNEPDSTISRIRHVQGAPWLVGTVRPHDEGASG